MAEVDAHTWVVRRAARVRRVQTLYVVLAGLGGVAIGVFVSESAKSLVGELVGAVARGRTRREAMRQLVLEIDLPWQGEHAEQDNGLELALMRVSGRLRNHGSGLVRDATVTMHGRPHGQARSTHLPAVAPGAEQPFEILYVLGLLDDQPFAEEAGDWRLGYTFEVGYADADGGRWQLSYDPAQRSQQIDRAS